MRTQISDQPVRVEVLGPFCLVLDGVRGEVTRPQVRTVLAILAASSNAVPLARLEIALWPDQAPADPSAALRTIVSRTRSALGDFSDRLLLSAGALTLDAGSDIAELDNCIRRSSSSAEFDPFQAEQLLDSIDLPFSGLIDSPEVADLRATAEVRRTELTWLLVDHYVAARNDEAVLRVGRPMLHKDPDDEQLSCVVATALARRGRKTEAIESLQTTRASLLARGLDVSPALAKTEIEILDGSTDLTDPGKEPATTSGQPALFVGRETELAALLDLAIGDAVYFEGEAGIGKTALIDVFEQRCLGPEIKVVRVGAAQAAAAPMQAFAVIAERLLSFDGVVAKPEHEASLSMLLPDRVAVAGRAPSRAALVNGIVDFVVNAAEQTGSVLVIDDAQWLDSTSALAVRELLQLGRCRLVLTARPGHQSRLVGSFDQRVTHISLPSLSMSECGDVVRVMLPEASDASVEDFRLRSGGNPFFLGTLLDLAEQDLGQEDSLPPVVLLAVQKRFNILSLIGRRALQLAAVVGQNCTKSVVEKIEPGVSPGVDEAIGAGLLIADATGVVSFTHAIVADAAYQQLGDADRMDLHDQAGRVLEAESVGSVEVFRHCREAAAIDPSRSLEFASLAAAAHLSAFAWEDAAEAATWGLAALDDVGGGLFGSSHRLEIAKASADISLGVANSHLQLVDGARQAFVARDASALIGAVVELCNSGSGALTGLDVNVLRELIDASLELAEPGEQLNTVRAAAARAFVYSPLSEYGQTLYAKAFADFDQSSSELRELILRNSEAGLSNPKDFADAKRATALLNVAADENPELRWLGRWFEHRDALISADGDRLAWALRDIRASATSLERRHAFVVLGQTFDMEMQRSWAESSMALLHGDFELAETSANQALEIGLQQLAIRGDGFGDGWVTASYGLLLLAIRHGQGRLHELVDVVETTAPLVPAWRVAIVIANLAAGNIERVEAELEILTADNFSALVPDPTWTAATLLLAEPVAKFSSREVIRELYEQMLPFADRLSFSGLCTFGPMHEGLAVLADAFGDTVAGDRHRDSGVALVESLRQSSRWGYELLLAE